MNKFDLILVALGGSLMLNAMTMCMVVAILKRVKEFGDDIQ